jgi:hypothetical protein
MKVFYLMPLFWLLLGACGSSNTTCEQTETRSGIILGKYAATCAPVLSFDRFVIASQADLDSVFGVQLPNCTVPPVDFENEMVLGFLTEASGCEVLFHKDVQNVEPLRRYLFTVTTESCGNCRSKFFSYNWVRVPRLPAGYTVEFMLRSASN